MRSAPRFFNYAPLLPLVLAVVVGCGGSDVNVSSAGGDSSAGDSSDAPSAPETAGGPDAEMPAEPTGEAAAEPDTDPMLTDPMPGGATDIPGDQVAAQFPDDVAEWKPDDFRNAARTTNPRLKPAVEQLVNTTPGDAKTAELLTELLTLIGQPSNENVDGAVNPDSVQAAAQPMPAGFDGTTGQNGADAGGLVRAIIDGLATNNSDQAWQTLTQVLAGEIKTVVDDREIADWVLTTALDSYGGDDHPSHALLKAALQKPKSLNAARGEELRGQVNAVIAGTAASVMDQLLGVPDPAASARLPGEGDAPTDGSSPLPGTSANGQPIPAAGGLGLDGTASPWLPARRTLSNDALRNAIQYLWCDETLRYVEGNTRNIVSLDNGFDTLALAGSLPTTGMRQATFDLLYGHWKDGAGPLLSRRLYQAAVRDPGMIVVLKQLPRLMPKGPLINQQSATANPRAGKSQREAIAKQSWMAASAYMVRAVINRLQVATSQQENVTLPKLPIRLHREGRVLGVREIRWPADISALTSGVTPAGPLSLQYVRIELSQNVPKIFNFYKKQLRRGKDYQFPEGAWIDSLTVGSKIGTRRSIDVLFTKNAVADGANQDAGTAPAAGGYSAGAYGTGQQQAVGQFTLEILVVEIADPRRPDAP